MLYADYPYAGSGGFLVYTAGFLRANAPNVGFVASSRTEDLIEAVRVIAGGNALLAPSVTKRIITEFAQRPARPEYKTKLAHLTEREAGVLRLIAKGKTNAEIAADLYVGEATVKTHMSNVLMTLDLRDRVQAVVYAYESGLISPGSDE